MKWKPVPIGGLRKVGPSDRPGFVDLIHIPKAGPDDVDLSQSKIWVAQKGGHSYAVGFDGMYPDRGFTATTKALGGRKARQGPTTIITGAPTFEAAAAACLKHAKGRMT